MSPFIEHGQKLLFVYFPARWIHKGQIVLCSFTSEINFIHFNTKNLRIKRVLGISGDQVSFNINNMPAYLKLDDKKSYDVNGQISFDVPAGHIFLQGDNLLFSEDSRWLGPLAYNKIYGVAILRLSANNSIDLQKE